MSQAFQAFNIVCMVFSAIIAANARRISKGTCGSDAVFYRVASNHILDEEPISKNNTNDLNDCIDICVELPTCIAINMKKRQDSTVDCHLLKDDHNSKPNKLREKNGWSLYFTGTSDYSRSIGSKCLTMKRNPCPSHCTCVDTCDSYRCECYGPKVYESCKDALLENPGSKQYFWIVPTGISAGVYVQCYKQSESNYFMTIRHDSQDRTYVHGYESKFSYQKSFTYDMNNLDDIIAVVDALGNCKQQTVLECKHMIYTGHGGLVDRNGMVHPGYLGGGSSSGHGCACGIDKTCHTSSTSCNCDANINTVLKDEGYVTNSTILPITGIKLGDTGHSGEYAYYTIGSLQCFGRSTFSFAFGPSLGVRK